MSNHRPSLRADLLSEGIVADPDSYLVERGFGELVDGKLWFFSEEALFLVETGKLRVFLGEKELGSDELRRELEKRKPGFFRRYIVYRDLRTKGYVVKAGAKYGVDFRVYDKGVKPRKGDKEEWEHAKFLVWVIGQDFDIPAKTLIGINRVANSVKKRLWLAVVDNDLGVTYIQMFRVTP